ncbi:MAG: HipA domain-containing protein [Gemmatimonadota bacterium]
MLFIPQSAQDRQALNKAAQRGRLRRIAHGVYTDDWDVAAEEFVTDNALAILGAKYPDSHISHSTAALMAPNLGTAFLSTPGTYRRTGHLPGLRIKRLSTLPYPQIRTIDLSTRIKRNLTADPESATVRASSPLQTVFELLASDRRHPGRTLPDATVAALIDSLASTDLLRAEAFARRNGLDLEYRKFERLRGTTSAARRLARHPAVEVFFYHYRLGRLEQLSFNEFRFEYDQAWNIALNRLSLDRRPAYEGIGLPPFFDNLLPEGWAEAKLQAVHKLSRDDVFGLLRTTPKYLSNVTLRSADFDASSLMLDHLTCTLGAVADTGSSIDVFERIGESPGNKVLWLEMQRRGSTRLAGVQPKLPVHLVRKGTEHILELAEIGNTSTHILKLPSPHYSQLIENEWATMELARLCELSVAPAIQVRFARTSKLPSPGLLIERFDIPAAAETPPLILMEEAASLLDLLRSEKYRTSIERITDALVRTGLERFEPFFDHVAFSWIVGNGDLHAKNIAVLREIQPSSVGKPPGQQRVRYAPLYDLVNTRLVLTDDSFALSINGKQDRIRLKDFRIFGRRLGWRHVDVDTRVEALLVRITSNLDAVLARSGLSEEKAQRYKEVVAANAAHLLGR